MGPNTWQTRRSLTLAATLIATGCGGSTTTAERPDAATASGNDAGAKQGSSSDGAAQGASADSAAGEDTTNAEDASEGVDGAIAVVPSSPPEASTGQPSPGFGVSDAGFPTPFASLDPDSGTGANCPPTCDPGTLCVDNMVQKLCAKRCTSNLDCATSECCTLLSDGVGACVSVPWGGPMPGQLCLCNNGHCPGGTLTCAAAKDNAGNPTGPDVCM